MAERLSPSEYDITFESDIFTIEELYQGDLPKIESAISIPGDHYESLAAATSIQVARLNGQDIARPTWIATASPIDAFDLNYMLYCIAHAKAFGLDTNDIISDYNSLHSQLPDQIARRGRHENKIPGWGEASESLERIVSMIDRSFSRSNYALQKNLQDTLVGYIVWEEAEDGKQLIHMPQSHQAISQLATVSSENGAPQHRYDNTVGMIMLAAFSPMITQKWGGRLAYSDKSEDQRHGTLQAIVTPWTFRETLRESPLFVQLQQRAVPQSTNTTGEKSSIGEIEDHGTQEDKTIGKVRLTKEDEIVIFGQPLQGSVAEEIEKILAQAAQVLKSLKDTDSTSETTP